MIFFRDQTTTKTNEKNAHTTAPVEILTLADNNESDSRNEIKLNNTCECFCCEFFTLFFLCVCSQKGKGIHYRMYTENWMAYEQQ